MAIIIKKGRALGKPEPAAVVEDVAPPDNRAPVRDPAKWWEMYGLPENPPLLICAYCKQSYYKPCTEEQHGMCSNYLYVAGMGVEK